jgi:excisionase family DNA binding protein
MQQPETAVTAPDQVLSTFEVAAELGVSPPTVRALVKTGTLRARRIGKLFKITRADLDAFKATAERRAVAA